MRVVVVGTSGSGKTTLAGRIARAIGARQIELDALNWQPGWTDLSKTEPALFTARVREAAAAEAWAADGNYGIARPILLERATHLIWLDYSRAVVMGRVLRRSLLRALDRRELWPGTGNRESFARWLDPGHPIRWAWTTHHPRAARFAALFEDPALAHLERRRLTRPAEAEALVAALARTT